MLYYTFVISRNDDAVQAYKATVLLYTLMTQRLGVVGLVAGLLGMAVFGMLFYSLKLFAQTCGPSRVLQASTESFEETQTLWNTDVENGCEGCSQSQQDVAAELNGPIVAKQVGTMRVQVDDVTIFVKTMRATSRGLSRRLQSLCGVEVVALRSKITAKNEANGLCDVSPFSVTQPPNRTFLLLGHVPRALQYTHVNTTEQAVTLYMWKDQWGTLKPPKSSNISGFDGPVPELRYDDRTRCPRCLRGLMRRDVFLRHVRYGCRQH